jgi:hypothetical protein
MGLVSLSPLSGAATEIKTTELGEVPLADLFLLAQVFKVGSASASGEQQFEFACFSETFCWLSSYLFASSPGNGSDRRQEQENTGQEA